MIKLGQTTTGNNYNVKYLWLVKDLNIQKYNKKKCYVVRAFNGGGWWNMYNGTLAECREIMKGEKIVEI